MQRKLAAVVLIAGSLLWIGLIVAAPAGRAQGWPATYLVDLLFTKICHQIPERSFHLAGEPLAVCHRCFGIYLGFLAGAVLLPFWNGLRRLLLAHPRLLLIGFGLMAVDVFLVPNTWWTRFASGLIAALPVAAFVHLAISQMLAGSHSVEPSMSTNPS